MSAGRIILLNGASSSGKSTLARALQAAMGTPFLHLSSDQWIDAGAVPDRRDDGPFDWVSSMRPRFFDGFHRTIAAMAAAGNDLIVDHIIEYPSWRTQLAQLLSRQDVFFVAVRCDLAELQRREQQRGNRHTGEALAHLHDNRIHDFGPVDATIDTTAGITPVTAQAVITAWQQRTGPSAIFDPDPSIYDAADVFDRYSAHRGGERYRSPNVVMEEPAVLAEVGDPAGLRVLDLGCGDAQFGRHLLAAGAASYRGIDNSRRMIAAAAGTLVGTTGRAELASIDEVDVEPGSVDLVTARLSLHYLPDVGPVFTQARSALAPGGRMIITVVHPVITSHDNQPDGLRTTWTVDTYFDTGPRVREWMGAQVTWWHRTVEDYVVALTDAALTVTAVRECRPDPARFDGHTDEYDRRSRVPLFLFLAARA